MQNLLTDVCSTATRTTPRSCSSSAGCITSRARASPAKSRRLSTWRSRLALVRFPFIFRLSAVPINTWQTTTTLRVGTSLADVTCHSRSTPRHMRPTSRQSTVMAGTQLSGAPLVCCTTRSTSTEMHLMRTPARYVSTLTSPRFGTTLALW